MSEVAVVLEPIRRKLADDLRLQRNKPEIRRWCRQVGLIEEAEQEAWADRLGKDPSIRMFAICDVLDLPTVVGICGLTSILPVHNSAEFSIYIFTDCQRKGYARAALKTLIRHGFLELNLNRIWGETFEGNPGARLYEQLGFVKEGDLRETYYKDGKYINSSIWSILRKDYAI